MAIKVNVGGELKELKELYFNDKGTIRKLKEVFTNTGTEIKSIFNQEPEPITELTWTGGGLISTSNNGFTIKFSSNSTECKAVTSNEVYLAAGQVIDINVVNFSTQYAGDKCTYFGLFSPSGEKVQAKNMYTSPATSTITVETSGYYTLGFSARSKAVYNDGKIGIPTVEITIT